MSERGLRCSVYISKEFGNCSNGGISSRVKRVTLMGLERGHIFEPTDDSPAVWLHKKGDYIYVSPERVPLESGRWYMPGGTFIYSSDSRFPSDCPLPLHDRLEG